MGVGLRLAHNITYNNIMCCASPVSPLFRAVHYSIGFFIYIAQVTQLGRENCNSVRKTQMHVAVRPQDHAALGAQDAPQTISARVVFAYGGDRRVKTVSFEN